MGRSSAQRQRRGGTFLTAGPASFWRGSGWVCEGEGRCPQPQAWAPGWACCAGSPGGGASIRVGQISGKKDKKNKCRGSISSPLIGANLFYKKNPPKSSVILNPSRGNGPTTLTSQTKRSSKRAGRLIDHIPQKENPNLSRTGHQTISSFKINLTLIN